MGWIKTIYPEHNVRAFAMVMGINSPNFLIHSLSKRPLIPHNISTCCDSSLHETLMGVHSTNCLPCAYSLIEGHLFPWVFPEIGVPQNGWFIWENSIPPFMETSILWSVPYIHKLDL